MNDVNYAFFHAFENPTGSRISGDTLLVTDVQNSIINQFGPPRYAHNDRKAFKDPQTLIIAINPSLRAPVGDSRWLGVYAPNDNFGGGPAVCEIILLPSYNKPGFIPKKEIQPGTLIFPVHALPSRATPDALQKAVIEDPFLMREKIKEKGGPVTTFVIGDLSGGCWKAEKFYPKIKKLMEQRGGSVLLTTSPRTKQTDEQEIVALLQPWLADYYSWNKSKGANKPNPYLAMLGFADEVIIQGNSLSTMSDAVASQKPLRIIWQRVTQEMRERYEIFEGYPENSMYRRLRKYGAKNLSDDPVIAPPFSYDTGLPAATHALFKLIRKKSLALIA